MESDREVRSQFIAPDTFGDEESNMSDACACVHACMKNNCRASQDMLSSLLHAEPLLSPASFRGVECRARRALLDSHLRCATCTT